MLALRARDAAVRGAAIAESVAADVVASADFGARHQVKDEAKAGQAVHGEVEHSRGTARRRFAGRDRGAVELERLEASLVLGVADAGAPARDAELATVASARAQAG